MNVNSIIPGLEEAVVCERLLGLLLVVPIAEHDVVAADEQLAGLIWRQHVAILVDHFDLGVRYGSSDRAHHVFQLIAHVAERAERGRLGHAIANLSIRSNKLKT